MKKTFFPGLFLAVAITHMINAQSSVDTSKDKIQFDKIINGNIKYDSLVWNEINSNAIRNFTRDYSNVLNAKWFKSSNGLFVAYFTSQDIRNWVYYNKKGDFEYMTRHYNEDKLPPEIRHMVKGTYYDFNIHFVAEIKTNKKIAYHIKMADKTTWKTIKVVDGEMEVTEEYVKAKN